MDQLEGESGEDQDGSQSEGSESYKVVVDGQEQEVPLDELISGYQRQADYTQKTQELAGEKDRYQQLIEDKATELYLKALEEQKGAGNQEPSSVEDKIKSLQDKLEDTTKTLEEKDADRELDKMMSGLREKYPDMDEEKVLIRFHNEAQEHDDPNGLFEKFASESHNNYGEMKKKIIDEYISSKSVSPFDKGETGNSTAPTSKASKPVTTFEEARERAEARLRGFE